WIGASSDAGIKRATELGDGFIFGTAGPQFMAEMTPKIRASAEENNRKNYKVAGVAYFAVGDDAQAALEAGSKSLLRYYGGSLWAPPEQIIHHGPIEVIEQVVREYADAGLDLLYLMPVIPEVKQVDLIAEHVLPAYRIPGR
ncbi:MAG TPA: LLM class flavin-dependent oxidoreductase, partial [Actinomycetota bacterium]|nr:LLM class flavin-dependent oxidoreductase [Actinomycetota bacterium]